MSHGTMRLFGLKTCDTCRRAMRELAAAGLSPVLVDMRANGVETADLERFYAAFGEALVNRRSTTWRGLSDAVRKGDHIALIRAHPPLMKRPVIDAGGRLTLGWDAKTRESWLGSAA